MNALYEASSIKAAVPAWLGELHRLREAGKVPLAGGVLLSLGVPTARRWNVIDIPNSYRPEPGDDYSALAALSVELVFDAACGFHRLRILCENILAAQPDRLILLAADEPQSTFIVLKPGPRS
ncbi:hypothetical protein [Cupriavidus sp. AcVe19-6a]|uniref:hypothetical protein n=1 Tax=Cupriavidus sp. AcVe19-6a TaxID=2821358 RepID=UPI001AE699FB|nr:hypothetical protein [Cupriavidus sp. AcVe19-6a]MBP0639574.1 hypothetical protein [Cupriavidus sp. AcVe19-6a]